MGCGPTLTATVSVLEYSEVICSNKECPNPKAVTDILCEPSVFHLVELHDATYNIMHPLHERINNELLRCDFSQFMDEQAGPPVAPGHYRVYQTEKGWQWDEATQQDRA